MTLMNTGREGLAYQALDSLKLILRDRKMTSQNNSKKMTGDRQKVLILSWLYPLPENSGGSMRTMHFVRFFQARGFDVDLAYRDRIPGAESTNSLFSREYFLKALPGDSLFREFVKKLNRRCIERIPHMVVDYEAASQEELVSAIESEEYTFILARYLYDTAILFMIPEYRTRIIIDFDDVLSGPIFAMHNPPNTALAGKLKNLFRKRLLIQYERKCLGFGAALFCSEQDRGAIAGKNENAFVVPNVFQGNSFGGYEFGNGFNNGNILLFVGTLSYLANAEGLKWFVKYIFPSFRENYQDAKLLVVGASPSEDIRTLCQEKGLQLHPDVADVKEYYRMCKAVIVPLLSGAGTRIKILEAGLANRPVLSTPLGAEGLDFRDGDELLLFQSTVDFLTKYQVLNRAEKYDQLARNAKRLVKEKFSVPQFDKSMNKVLEAMGIF